MRVGDLVRDSSYGLIGIIIAVQWSFVHLDSSPIFFDFGVLYEDGEIFGADAFDIEVIQ